MFSWLSVGDPQTREKGYRLVSLASFNSHSSPRATAGTYENTYYSFGMPVKGFNAFTAPETPRTCEIEAKSDNIRPGSSNQEPVGNQNGDFALSGG